MNGNLLTDSEVLRNLGVIIATSRPSEQMLAEFQGLARTMRPAAQIKHFAGLVAQNGFGSGGSTTIARTAIRFLRDNDMTLKEICQEVQFFLRDG